MAVLKHNVNNFVIDRILRGFMLSKVDKSVMWSINQITNPTLTISTETQAAVDALGVNIVELDRAKNAEFSGENSIFDLGLYAAQAGSEKEIASSSAKQTYFVMEDIEVTGTKVNLKHTPVGKIMEIHELNGDSTLGTKYVNGSEANETDFVHTEKGTEITLPTSVKTGSIVFVQYEYEGESGVVVHNRATEFPKVGIFRMEVLGCDVCNPEVKIHAYVEFPNAKLSSDLDFTFATETTHPFTIKALQDYCDREKKLLSIYIPDEE